MSNFVRYDEAGAVTEWGSMSDAVIERLKAEGQRIVFGGTGSSPDFFVDLGTLKVLPKAENPAQIDGMTLRGVPVPSKLQIGAAVYDTYEPDVDLSFVLPGEYALTLTSPRHLTKRFTALA